MMMVGQCSLRTRHAILFVFCSGVLGANIGCTVETKRLAPDALAEEEEGTGLTSQDFRLICQMMARSLFRIEQIQHASTPPKIVLLEVVNNTNDYIDAEEFTHKMLTLLIRHRGGKRVLFISPDPALRDQRMEEEQGDVQHLVGREKRYGADFFLTSRIRAISRVTDGVRTLRYRVSFSLADADTSDIVWEDEYEIEGASRAMVIWRDSQTSEPTQLSGRDCNDNGIPDETDIETGASKDENGNGVPDECE